MWDIVDVSVHTCALHTWMYKYMAARAQTVCVYLCHRRQTRGPGKQEETHCIQRGSVADISPRLLFGNVLQRARMFVLHIVVGLEVTADSAKGPAVRCLLGRRNFSRVAVPTEQLLTEAGRV